MKRLAGVYVVVGAMMPPAVMLLGDSAIKLFNDRHRVAGREAALHSTFGNLCEYAFQATDEMLAYLMEHATRDNLPHADELAAIASKIVLGKPLGNGKDYFEGGLKVVGSKDPPRKPSPGGATFQLRPNPQLVTQAS